MLLLENARRWFSLSFKEGKPPAIRVAIWKPCVPQLTELFEMSGVRVMARDFIGRYDFEHYEPDAEKSFGFDEAMSRVGVENGYLILQAPLSRKKDEQTTAVASLEFLLWALCFYPIVIEGAVQADAKHLQLMEVELRWVVLGDSPGRGSMSGIVSPVFTDWVEQISKGRRQLQEVEEAMRLAWNAMSEKKSVFLSDFRALVHDKGGFSLSYRGNACDVSTRHGGSKRDGTGGYEFNGDNLDTKIQLLCLLAGLAKIHDLASKDIDHRPPT